jgi:hypothetical protein
MITSTMAAVNVFPVSLFIAKIVGGVLPEAMAA